MATVTAKPGPRETAHHAPGHRRAAGRLRGLAHERTASSAALCALTVAAVFVAELGDRDLRTLKALAVLPVLVAAVLRSRRAAVAIVALAILLRVGAAASGHMDVEATAVEAAVYALVGLVAPTLLLRRRDDPGPVTGLPPSDAEALDRTLQRRRRTDLPAPGGRALPLPVARVGDRLQRAMAHVEGSDDGLAGTASALRALGCAQLMAGRTAPAETSLRRSVVLAQENGAAADRSASIAALALALTFDGRLADADHLIFEAALGSMAPSLAVVETGALIHWLAGRGAAAVSGAVEASTLSGGAPAESRVLVMAVAAIAAAEVGRTVEAAWYRAQAATTAESCELPGHLVHWADGVIAWRGTGAEDALPLLHRAAEGLENEGALAVTALVLADMAEAAAESGRAVLTDRARRALARAATDCPSTLARALADAGTAWERIAAGDFEAAVEPAQAASTLLGSGGYGRLAARARHALGIALAPADPAAATDILRNAASALTTLQDTWAAERVSASLRRLRTATRVAAAPGLEALTRRERQVAQLAAEGLTSKEIGTQLFIGERTVETHLANAYGKLGIRSRTELVAVLAEPTP